MKSMAEPLPRLRTNLDFMPSPVPERPGLLIRDPFHYSDATLIIPRALVACLEFFDGRCTDLDLRARLVSLTGDLRVGEVIENLVKTLSEAGFLENDVFARMKEERHKRFVEAPCRTPVHSGSAYPENPAALRRVLDRVNGAAAASDSLLGLAAPHVSPEGGWDSYQAAYSLLGARYRDRTFVILGTSHYGEPERFGLTRKDFLTPLGQAQTDQALVDWLARQAPQAITMEDYCHSVEHSIEFQVVFLQHLCGPDVRILPVLCGPYARSLYQGGPPEQDERVKRFLDALAELAAREGNRLFWVLGVDMAHMGRRYGDSFAARADQGEMSVVAHHDRRRIERIVEGDADGFWDLVQEKEDPLKWCGASPLYTFLKAVPQARGKLIRYQQWNIDEQSVVSFGAISFSGNTDGAAGLSG